MIQSHLRLKSRQICEWNVKMETQNCFYFLWKNRGGDMNISIKEEISQGEGIAMSLKS